MSDPRRVLYDGYAVSASFYDALLTVAEEAIPWLIRGAKYTAKELIGDPFWSQLGPGEQRMAGRCLASMVCTGQLPLCFADSQHEYPKYYRLK